MIDIPDLLKAQYSRGDFDEVEYYKIFFLLEGLGYHYLQIDNPSTYEARIVMRNYNVLREIILDKLREPSY